MPTHRISAPYLLFLGDAPDQLSAKTAEGVATWRRDDCIGQLRFKDCKADLGLPDMTVRKAAEAGAKTLVIGIANRGGSIGREWLETMHAALDVGMDIAAGLHHRLCDIPSLHDRAQDMGRRLHDVRHPPAELPIGTGQPRSGKRVLTVGTDCSVGKMYTALHIAEEMQLRGVPRTFRATGQTGILIAGSGLSVDAVVSDFISGAVELLAPAADDDHWDVIEGQGSLMHPSYAGVSLGLLHGAAPDALILCHEPTRPHMRGLPDQAMPDLDAVLDLNEKCARLTNPAARVVGLSINTRAMEQAEAEDYLQGLADRYDMPACDPGRTTASDLVDAILAE
ncbi:MAG: DUF1611 domain-containing protein [Alphaproteobacteria bacterium]